MLQALLGFVTGRAAKAGAALLAGVVGAPVAVQGYEAVRPALETYEMGGTELTLLGFLMVGALQGAINWVATYYTANK